MTTRYATVSIYTDRDGTDSGSPSRSTYTDALGCSEIVVDGYWLPAGGIVTLPALPEQVCIPIGTDGSVTLDGTRLTLPGVGCVQAGVERSLRCSTPTVLAVVSASPDSTGEGDTTTVALDECEFTAPSTSTIKTARLTARLGCAGMKVNARVLEPGERVPYHTEGDQEELFVPLTGPATMRIDDHTYETPAGTLTRVAPPVPRSAINDGDAEALWVMIGAPPTGGPTEWDPGAEMLE